MGNKRVHGKRLLTRAYSGTSAIGLAGPSAPNLKVDFFSLRATEGGKHKWKTQQGSLKTVGIDEKLLFFFLEGGSLSEFPFGQDPKHG